MLDGPAYLRGIDLPGVISFSGLGVFLCSRHNLDESLLLSIKFVEIWICGLYRTSFFKDKRKRSCVYMQS